jgi:hypothetical protein
MDLTWIQHRYMSKWTYLFIKKTGRIKKFCKLSELRFTNIKKQENQINKKKVHKHTCKCEGEGRGRMDASVGETCLWCASEGRDLAGREGRDRHGQSRALERERNRVPQIVFEF